MQPIAYFHLLEMFPKSGCAICNLLLNEAQQKLESILYEYITDGDINSSFRGSRGLCSEHGWQITRMHKALGAAILYEAALDEILKIMQRTAPDESQRGKLLGFLTPKAATHTLSDALEPTQPCIICELQTEQEIRLAKFLGDFMIDEKMQAAYRASDGLCLEHFKITLRHTPHADHAAPLIAIQREIWHALRAELREFMRKNDTTEAPESFGAERTSWRRAIARLSGEDGMFGNRR